MEVLNGNGANASIGHGIGPNLFVFFAISVYFAISGSVGLVRLTGLNTDWPVKYSVYFPYALAGVPCDCRTATTPRVGEVVSEFGENRVRNSMLYHIKCMIVSS